MTRIRFGDSLDRSSQGIVAALVQSSLIDFDRASFFPSVRLDPLRQGDACQEGHHSHIADQQKSDLCWDMSCLALLCLHCEAYAGSGLHCFHHLWQLALRVSSPVVDDDPSSDHRLASPTGSPGRCFLSGCRWVLRHRSGHAYDVSSGGLPRFGRHFEELTDGGAGETAFATGHRTEREIIHAGGSPFITWLAR